MTTREATFGRRIRMALGLLPVIVVVVGIAWLAGAFESRSVSVYVVCEDCGLSKAETDDDRVEAVATLPARSLPQMRVRSHR